MKNVLLCFCFLTVFYSSITAQITSGIVTYGVEINYDIMEPSDDASFNTFRTNGNIEAKKLKFKLNFNKQESLFKLSDQMPIDNNNLTVLAAIDVTRGNGIFYTHLSEDLLIEQTTLYGENFRFKKEINENQWQLTNEKKQIGVYTCYKATGIRYKTDRKYEKHEVPVYAWYCPELPFQFGPFETVGLPGLVLEYGISYWMFVAEDIQLSKESIKIKVPKSGKLTTMEEVQKEMGKRYGY